MKSFSRKLLAILMLACAINIAAANPVGPNSAKAIAITFYKQNSCQNRNDVRAENFQEVANSLGFHQLYVFRETQGHGFVIVSADDCARPVLAYSDESDFDANDIPQSVHDWLIGYEMQISEAIALKAAPLPEVAMEWEMLRNGQIPAPKSACAVEPLITAQWGQGSPYNAMCPTNTLVGCVAVAMGEVMRYWQHPVHGTGSHSYTYAGQSISADFSAATYNYAAMPNTCSNSNTAVATLLYHCGVAVQMEYGSSVSSAYVLNSDLHPYNAESALKNFFGYSTHAHGELRSDFTKAQWISMLKEDLDAGHPVIHNGYNSSNSGGHCFICDGYDNSDYFHFNWGQRGAYDGYFELDAMTPSNQNFSYNQGGIFGLVPATEDEDGITEGNAREVMTISPNPTNGILHISITDEIRNAEYQVFNTAGEQLLSDKITSNDFSVNLNELPDGIYFVRIVSGQQATSTRKIVKSGK